MSISLKPEHLARYKDVARLLFKYGRSDLVTNAGLNDLMPQTFGAAEPLPFAEIEKIIEEELPGARSPKAFQSIDPEPMLREIAEIFVPQPVQSYSSARLLTMEFRDQDHRAQHCGALSRSRRPVLGGE